MKTATYESHIRFLIIGINDYEDDQLYQLDSPENDAARLHKAITQTSPFAIPAENVLCLTKASTQKNVTKAELVSHLQQFIAKTSKDDHLYLYFAGHGERNNENFYLCAQDTRTDDLSGTALSSKDIDSLFQNVEVKGLLFIIDCCKSAGFAEYAPDIFKNSSSSDFRILISASGKDELSWEIPGGKGTLFTNFLLENLNGNAADKHPQSFIFFNELFEDIYGRMEEEFEIHPAANKQQPVFTGTYSRNPLLFAASGLSTVEVQEKVQRYSRQFLLKRVKKAVAFVLLACLFLLGSYYTFIDQHQYASINDSGQVEIYQGYPGYNAFGYPHLLWQTALSSGQLNSDSKFKQTRLLVSRIGEPVLRELLPQLMPLGRQLLLIQEGEKAEAKKEILNTVKTYLKSNSDAKTILPYVQMLTTLADSSDEPIYGELVKYHDPALNDEIAKLLAQDFDRNYQVLASLKGNEFITVRTTILKNVILRRQPSILLKTWLGAVCRSDSAYIEHSGMVVTRILLAASIQKISLPPEDILAMIYNCRNPDEDISDIMAYVNLTQQVGVMKDLLISRLKTYNAAKFDNWAKINHSLLALSFIQTPCLPEYSKYYNFNAKYFAPYAAAALVNACSGQPVSIENAYTAPYLAKAHRLNTDTLLRRLNHPDPNAGSDQMIPLLKACFDVHDQRIIQFLLNLPKDDSYISALRLEVLDSLKVKQAVPQDFLAGGDMEVAAAALSWLYHQNPQAAFNQLLRRLNNFAIGDENIASIFSAYKPSETEMGALKTKLQGNTTEKQRAAIIIAVCGSERDALAVISDKDIAVRDAATRYIPLNRSFLEIVKSYKPDPVFPDFVPVGLENYQRFTRLLRWLFKDTPDAYRPELKKLFIKTNQGDYTFQLMIAAFH